MMRLNTAGSDGSRSDFEALAYLTAATVQYIHCFCRISQYCHGGIENYLILNVDMGIGDGKGRGADNSINYIHIFVAHLGTSLHPSHTTIIGLETDSLDLTGICCTSAIRRGGK